MAGPLEGIRVVELGVWVAGPSASGVLADWGAEVIKIESATGDPFRGLYVHAAGVDVPANPPFELDNRGKRSVALDLTNAAAAPLLDRLLADADVFVTNVRASTLARLGLGWDALHERHPRLVYAHVTGYGADGPDADRPAYDVGAFWARTGMAAALTPPGADPPLQRGAMGDHTAGISLAGGVAAALVARARTGEGQLVSTSLLRVGGFVLGWDLNATLRLGIPATPFVRTDMPNPVISAYRSGDDHWFWLLGLQGQRHWPDLVAAVERPELLADPRFATMTARRENAPILVGMLDEIFASRPMAEWAERLDRAGMWWAPMQTTEEVVVDPQARAAGLFIEVPQPEGDPLPAVATPCDFSGTPWSVSRPSPECGQHTEEVLLELGYDWEAIAKLKEQGAIP
jgi:crotonobetainyl-CoA:carnitine CoA-transferase CaiB-like acyl-CoA transferase